MSSAYLWHGTSRGNKYHARATIDAHGRRFDSRAEMRRYQELELLEVAGRISELQRQVPFTLAVNGVRVARYVADATYVEDGKLVVEDVKSPATRRNPTYSLKRKLLKACCGLEIREVD
jgi:hypothetical protein